MTVQRQYTLPNCSLIIEGLSSGSELDLTAPLTVVLNAECQFPGMTDTLAGGREFLDALVKTVSEYAQSVLSGISYPRLEGITESSPVALTSQDNGRHQLAAIVTDVDNAAVHKTLTLNTIQLFDLMEAVDQFLADAQTLPDMTLQVSPLHRRYARATEPAAKRVVPAAAGLSALAASAALLFMVPVPEVEPVRPRDEQATSTLVEGDEPGTSDSSPADTTGGAVTEATSNGPDDAATADAISAATALSRLNQAPAITDQDAIARLAEDLEATLEAELAGTAPYPEPLVYRVAVSESGDLLGYKYENDAALNNVDNTPLPELTFIPVNPDQTPEESVAQFRVTFDPDGEVIAEFLPVGDETDNPE